MYLTTFLAVIAGILFYAFAGSAPSVPIAANVSPNIPVATSEATVAAAVPATSAQSSTQESVTASAASTSTPDNAGSRTSYTIPVLTSESVLDAMRAFAASSSFTFTGRDYPSLGFFVESINGKESTGGYNWMLYVDGTQSPKGASQEMVAPGDAVEWRYEQ